MDQAKVSWSLWKKLWPKLLRHDSFSKFVSSCVVCCRVHLQCARRVLHKNVLYIGIYKQKIELQNQAKKEKKGERACFPMGVIYSKTAQTDT